jgi:hypothetical protein
LSIGFLSFQGNFLARADQAIHDGLGDHRIFEQKERINTIVEVAYRVVGKWQWADKGSPRVVIRAIIN